VLFLLAPRLSFSETVDVNGYPFAVDRIENVDANSLTLTLFGETVLVKRSELNDEIVRAYLNRSELFELVQVPLFTEFLVRALRENRSDWVRPAVEIALGADELSELEQANLVRTLAPEQGAVDVFKSVLQSISSGPHLGGPVCTMVHRVAGQDLAWVKANAVRHVFRFRVTCEELLQRGYLESLISGDISNATLQLSIYGALYGIDSEGYQATLRLRGVLDGIVEGLRAADFSGAEKSIATFLSNPAYRREAPAIIDSLLAQFMSSALAEARFSDAFRFSSLQGPDVPSPKVTTVLKRMLAAAVADPTKPALVRLPSGVLSGMRVRALLDPEIRDGYLAYVTSVIRYLAANNQLLEALSWLDQLLSLRADPSVGNDDLRILLVEAFLDAGDTEKAQNLLADVQSSGHGSVKLRVFLHAKRFGLAITIVFGLLILAFAARFLIGRLMPLLSALLDQKPSPQPNVTADSTGSEPLRKFVSVHRAGGIKGGRLDPYVELLRLFDLKVGADLHAIKVAFRNSVKECHPDLTPNPTPEKTAKFIELKEAYERLLQLHEERAKKG
jgi:hypothetical protein